MAVPTVTSVRAADLKVGDVFTYSHEDVTVVNAAPLDSRFVEVTVTDGFGQPRWLDYGKDERVEVTAGPSTQERPAPVPPVKTATQRAREAVRLRRTGSLPASASLVLYALAAAQDEQADSTWLPSLGSIATGAGLAQSTTRGHLLSLVGKGLVRANGNGWMVTA